MGVKPTFYRRFRGVALLIGSPAEGERHSAADKAFEMCDAESISLQEALEGAFGGSGGSNDEQMQARIDELERDNEIMADEVRRLQEEAGNGEGTGDGGYKAALKKIWAHPQTRLAAAFSIIVVTLALLATWAPVPNKSLNVFLPFAFGTLSLISFGHLYLDWMSAEDKKNGPAVVFLKSLIIIGGLILCIYEFYGTLVIMEWPDGPTNLVGALIVVIATVVLAISNAVPLLVKKLTKSKAQPFKMFRAWFA